MSPFDRARGVAAALLLAVPAAQACGGDAGPRQPAPQALSVGVGDVFFRSVRNGTENPAIDTVAAGGTVTWTWTATAGLHSVESVGSSGFASSDEMYGRDARHQVTFDRAGTYEYICALHGETMRGRIVVE